MAAMDKTNSRTGSLCIDPNSADAASSQTHLLQGYPGHGQANGHGMHGHHANGDTSLTALARRTNSMRNRSLRCVQSDQLRIMCTIPLI